jgi:hypothetical protein
MNAVNLYTREASPSFVFVNFILGLALSAGVMLLAASLAGVELSFQTALSVSLVSSAIGAVSLPVWQRVRAGGRVVLWLFSQGANIFLIHAIVGSTWLQSGVVCGLCFAVGLLVWVITLACVGFLAAALLAAQQSNGATDVLHPDISAHGLYHARSDEFSRRVYLN